MKFLYQYNLFLLLFYIFNFSEIRNNNNNTINNTKRENPFKENGNGYKCREKLEEYRQKFLSVKSFVLTDSNYKEYLNQNKVTLIYVHSACVQESHDFIPIIKYVSDFFNKKTDPDSPKIATLDITDDDNNWNNQYYFRSIYYPIILLNVKGKRGFIPYSGYYNAHSIITFLTKYSNDVIIPINNTNILDQILTPKLTYLSIISFNNKYMKTFKKISKGLSYVLFGDCTNQKICEEKFDKNIYKYSDFALIKNTHIESDFEDCPDNKKILEDGKKSEIIAYNYTNYQKLIEFIYLNTLPKIFNFTQLNRDLLTASLVNSIIYVRGREEKKTNTEISKILKKAINLENSKIKIGGILDPLNNQNEETLMDPFRLELEDYSVYGNVIIQTLEKNEQKIYRINIHQVNKDKEINEKNILQFVSEFNEGKLKPELKSENRPKTHPKDNLRMIVARSFDEEITYNNNVAVVLCLLTMNLTNLREHEDIIDLITMKLDALNDSLIFGFMDVGFNYMKNVPKYNMIETPYYRYYYKNKSEGYNDFKGNYSNIKEIEEWIAVNYGKENGEGFDDLIRNYIRNVDEQIKAEEEEKKRKEAEFERDVEAGNVTSFEMILGDGTNEAINITEQKIRKILEKKMEAERKKRAEEQLRNKTNNPNESNNKETDL